MAEASVSIGTQVAGRATPRAPLYAVRLVTSEVEGDTVAHQVMMLADPSGNLVDPTPGASVVYDLAFTYVSGGAADGKISTIVYSLSGVTQFTKTFNYNGSGVLTSIVKS